MEWNQMNQMYNNQKNFFQMPMNNNQFNNPMMNNPMMNNPMMDMPIRNNPMMNNPMMNMPMLKNPMMNNMMNPLEMNMQMMPGNQMMANGIKPIIQKSEEIKIPRKKYNAKREIPPILLKNANKKFKLSHFKLRKI